MHIKPDLGNCTIGNTSRLSMGTNSKVQELRSDNQTHNHSLNKLPFSGRTTKGSVPEQVVPLMMGESPTPEY